MQSTMDPMAVDICHKRSATKGSPEPCQVQVTHHRYENNVIIPPGSAEDDKTGIYPQ